MKQDTINMETSERTTYIPSCEFGCLDCVNDPAYIKAKYPSWYKELLKDDRFSCDSCKDTSEYDNEDK